LPIAGGLQVIHAAGHSVGHAALLWQRERLLIVGDVGSNVAGLADPLGFEDRNEDRRSQSRFASLTFDATLRARPRHAPQRRRADPTCLADRDLNHVSLTVRATHRASSTRCAVRIGQALLGEDDERRA
jgi:glyoxylase-like metal-dependent hydrolase (beta-lactamase superfamily II)